MQVRISQPAKSVTQSPSNLDQKWVLEFLRKPGAQYKEETMKWTGSSSTNNQLKIYFDSLEDAVQYAEENALSYEVVKANIISIRPKSYAANFK